jgi:hypothetical protein
VDHFLGELLLAAWEVVIERPEWSVGFRDDLVEPGARVALSTKQFRGGVQDALSRPACARSRDEA